MTSNTKIQAFIFDLGKVIVDWDPRYLLHEIAPDEERLKFLVEEVLDLNWFRAVDAGYSLSKAIAERSEIYPDYADACTCTPTVGRRRYAGSSTAHWTLSGSSTPPASRYILSNWANETWVRVEEDMTFLKYFQDRIISGQVGVANPTAIFDMAQIGFKSNRRRRYLLTMAKKTSMPPSRPASRLSCSKHRKTRVRSTIIRVALP